MYVQRETATVIVDTSSKRTGTSSVQFDEARNWCVTDSNVSATFELLNQAEKGAPAGTLGDPERPNSLATQILAPMALAQGNIHCSSSLAQGQYARPWLYGTDRDCVRYEAGPRQRSSTQAAAMRQSNRIKPAATEHNASRAMNSSAVHPYTFEFACSYLIPSKLISLTSRQQSSSQHTRT